MCISRIEAPSVKNHECGMKKAKKKKMLEFSEFLKENFLGGAGIARNFN